MNVGDYFKGYDAALQTVLDEAAEMMPLYPAYDRACYAVALLRQRVKAIKADNLRTLNRVAAEEAGSAYRAPDKVRQTWRTERYEGPYSVGGPSNEYRGPYDSPGRTVDDPSVYGQPGGGRTEEQR